MQPALNMFSLNWIEKTALLFTIVIIFLFGFIWVLSRKRKLALEYQELLICKDEILREFKEIRHEYNNILQGFVCIIEEEDWEELRDYKDSVLDKTKLLNRNNLTQLVKIKNKRILKIVYNLLKKGKESGKTINLNIYNDIEEIKVYKRGFNMLLQDYLVYAYEEAIKESEEINLKINANKQGLRFAFEYKLDSKHDIINSDFVKAKRLLGMNKNVFFNTFVQKDYQIQEILFSILN
jgi:hypothetical protein